MIDKATPLRGGKFSITGSRRIASPLTSIFTWIGDIEVAEENGVAHITLDGRFRLPGSRKKSAEIVVRLPLVFYRPSIIAGPFSDRENISAAAVWAEQAETAVGFIAENAAASTITMVDNALQTTFHAVDLHGRSVLHFTLALRNSPAMSDAIQLLRSEAAETINLQIPVLQTSTRGLFTAATLGLAALLDSKNCTKAGKERWYFRANERFDYGPGYPFFSAEASPALLRWSKFRYDETSERIAKLAARGTASDFAVIVGESGVEGNKGAFWDCAAGSPEALTFSAYNGEREYSIASNSRIAFALFQMFFETQDPLFRQAALNTCHWLLLKQNSAFYYDGAIISASTGKATSEKINFDGILAIRPLVAAFRATGNEVFIKNALKISKNLNSTLLPGDSAPCLYGKQSQGTCPVTLSAAVNALLDLDAEYPNQDVRGSLAVIADWLALCRFDESGHSCLNYDNAHSGSLECASAALRLFTFTGNHKWFRLAFVLTERVVEENAVNWRLADASLQLLLSLGKLIPGLTVELDKMSITIGWHKYAPDPAAATYYDIRDDNHAQIDFLPLVCHDTHHTILFILAPSDSSHANLTKRNLTPNTRIPLVDQVTNAPCTVDLPLHPLPYNLGRYAVIRVDP
jgi:hypothetical protein